MKNVPGDKSMDTTAGRETAVSRLVVLAILLGVAVLAAGCQSTVHFRSQPPGAKLFVNGALKGETPCRVMLKWTTLTEFRIRLEKEGYQSYVARLEGEPKWGYIIIDILFWPLLLINAYGPKPYYDFTLRPVGGEAPPVQVERSPEEQPARPGQVKVYQGVADRPRMACIEFRAGNDAAKEVVTTIQEMFCTGFVESKRFSIIERAQIEKILKEKQFVGTGEVDSETAKYLGKILGVRYLLIGSASGLGQAFEIDARLVDAETGETKIASNGRCAAQSQLRSTVHDIVNDLNRKFGEEGR
jgi:TolB-like protein